MTINDIYRWNGKLGSDWDAVVPNPPGPNKTNWDNLSDAAADPSFPAGDGDIAVIDLGGAIDITASGVGGGEEFQIVNASIVTFGSGNFGAGVDPEVGGMIIDEGAELIVGGGVSMADQGSLDIIGLTSDGTLTLQPDAGFDDLGMIVGADDGAHGEVSVDAAFGFLVAQSAPGSADGVLVVGKDGDGTVDVSDTSNFYSASAILGENEDSNGEVDLTSSTWSGSSLSIGPAGNGVANIGSGSTVVFTHAVVGPNGTLDVTGDGASPGVVLVPLFTLAFGTVDVTGGGEVEVGSAVGTIGAVSVGGLPLTALGTIKGDVALGAGGVVQATGGAPGGLTVIGNVHGTGTLEPLMTLELQGGVDAGVSVAFSASVGAQVGDLVLDVPRAMLGTVRGFGVGNTIDVQGSLYPTAVFAAGVTGDPGTLTLSGGVDAPLHFLVSGDYAADSFLATPGTSDTVVTFVACFAAGTRIATARGDVEVERLAIGDVVVTLGGAVRPVVWIGRRRIDCRRHVAPRRVWPVRVRAHAFGAGLPGRDLLLSPDHAVFVEDVLIPVRCLIDGDGVVQERVGEIVYFHVELDAHDVMLAEGLAVESYLDTGNRADFGNGGGVVRLHPAFMGYAAGDAAWWEARACAPIVVSGPKVQRARARLARSRVVGRALRIFRSRARRTGFA